MAVNGDVVVMVRARNLEYAEALAEELSSRGLEVMMVEGPLESVDLDMVDRAFMEGVTATCFVFIIGVIVGALLLGR